MRYMKRQFFVLAAALVLAACTSYPKLETTVPYTIKNGTIILDEPQREPGQESALGMTCEPIDTVRVGFVGLGMRGGDAVRRYTYIEGVKITALCDLLPERVAQSNSYLESRGWPKAAEYSGEE